MINHKTISVNSAHSLLHEKNNHFRFAVLPGKSIPRTHREGSAKVCVCWSHTFTHSFLSRVTAIRLLLLVFSVVPNPHRFSQPHGQFSFKIRYAFLLDTTSRTLANGRSFAKSAKMHKKIKNESFDTRFYAKHFNTISTAEPSRCSRSSDSSEKC